MNLQKQHQEGAPSDIFFSESPDSPGDGRAELDVKSRLLGTQSIGRVESSYLQALDKAEGQEGKQQEILLPETSLQPLQNSAGQPQLSGLPCEQRCRESLQECHGIEPHFCFKLVSLSASCAHAPSNRIHARLCLQMPRHTCSFQASPLHIALTMPHVMLFTSNLLGENAV